MAEPRVFISSTFYDLRHVRAALNDFVGEMGYVPVLHERGDIPYEKEQALEQYCYREIERCDLVIAIIGGNFGHRSIEEETYSISQREVKVALEQGKQVYIFIQENVFHEFEIYRSLQEEERKLFKPYHANDVRIHRFILELLALPRNNLVFQFDSAYDIISLCRKQWAGLFQRLLEQQSRYTERNLVAELKDAIERVNSVVGSFRDGTRNGRDLEDLLKPHHPAFTQLRRYLDVKFPIMFNNIEELKAILKHNEWREVPDVEWRDKERMEWLKRQGRNKEILSVDRRIFGPDGSLAIRSLGEWDQNFIGKEVAE